MSSDIWWHLTIEVVPSFPGTPGIQLAMQPWKCACRGDPGGDEMNMSRMGSLTLSLPLPLPFYLGILPAAILEATPAWLQWTNTWGMVHLLGHDVTSQWCAYRLDGSPHLPSLLALYWCSRLSIVFFCHAISSWTSWKAMTSLRHSDKLWVCFSCCFSFWCWDFIKLVVKVS